MVVSARPESEKRNAQLVVCQYVEAWYPHLDEAGRMAEANELLDILGLLEKPDVPSKPLSWKRLKD
jgi:hypothetical protein